MLIGIIITIIIWTIVCACNIISWWLGLIIFGVAVTLGYLVFEEYDKVYGYITIVVLSIVGILLLNSIEDAIMYNREYVTETSEYTTTEEKLELLSLKQIEGTTITSNGHVSKDTTVGGGFFVVVGAADVDTDETSNTSTEVVKKEYVAYWALGEDGLAKRYKINIDDMAISFLEDSSEKPYVKHITQIKHDYQIDSNKETKEEKSSNIDSVEYIFYLSKSLLDEIPQELIK